MVKKLVLVLVVALFAFVKGYKLGNTHGQHNYEEHSDVNPF